MCQGGTMQWGERKSVFSLLHCRSCLWLIIVELSYCSLGLAQNLNLHVHKSLLWPTMSLKCANLNNRTIIFSGLYFLVIFYLCKKHVLCTEIKVFYENNLILNCFLNLIIVAVAYSCDRPVRGPSNTIFVQAIVRWKQKQLKSGTCKYYFYLDLFLDLGAHTLHLYAGNSNFLDYLSFPTVRHV